MELEDSEEWTKQLSPVSDGSQKILWTSTPAVSVMSRETLDMSSIGSMSQSPVDEISERKLIHEFLSFIETIVHFILYKRMNYSPDAFQKINKDNNYIFTCIHPRLIEYIEMTSKKIVTLLVSNLLEGFHLNFSHENIIRERYLFQMHGNIHNVLHDLSEIEIGESIKNNISYLTTSLDLPHEDLLFNRFTISIGLKKPPPSNYESAFQNNEDIEVFPWSSLKTKEIPKDTQTISILQNRTTSIATFHFGNFFQMEVSLLSSRDE